MGEIFKDILGEARDSVQPLVIWGENWSSHLCFVFLLLSCMSCLYILGINPCRSHHLQYFLLFPRLSFCFVSFAMQKLVNLIRSHLFVFALISFALGD